MGNFNRNSSSRGGGFNRRNFDDRGSRSVEMHKAICDKCGKECEVPFRPTGGKPVFCSNCFDRNNNSDVRRPERDNSRRPDFNERQMFDAVCDECGNRCQVPFQPTSGKPIYCSNCYEGKNGAADRGNNNRSNSPDYSQQFQSLNAKLDSILKMLTATTGPEVELEHVVSEIAAQKPVKKAKAPKKSAPVEVI
ncbi:MAG: hypothetical protein Q7R99_04275 [bacterium]|nr:hypothetical protein [bacterium]